MTDTDLTETIAREHGLNPHNFGCACGKWTYRVRDEQWGTIDFEGHLMHVAAVTAAQVREQVAAGIEAHARRDTAWLSEHAQNQMDRARVVGAEDAYRASIRIAGGADS